jgi:ABC-type nitrate/sulfonate/bicarbonate transport system permease component
MLGDLAIGLTPFALILVLWQLTALYSGVSQALVPPLGDIFGALMDMARDGTLAADLAGSFRRLFESVILGCIVGTFAGVCMGYFRLWEKLTVLPLNFVLSVPGTALFPLAMIWFGLTEWAVMSVLVFEVVLTVTVTVWGGVKTVDASLIRAGRSLGASPFGMVWRVLIPAALPAIVNAYRLAFSRAWRILIIAEMMISVTAGLGYRLYWAREFFHYETVYAGLLVVGLSGLLIERVLLRPIEILTVERWGMVRT